MRTAAELIEELNAVDESATIEAKAGSERVQGHRLGAQSRELCGQSREPLTKSRDPVAHRTTSIRHPERDTE